MELYRVIGGPLQQEWRHDLGHCVAWLIRSLVQQGSMLSMICNTDSRTPLCLPRVQAANAACARTNLPHSTMAGSVQGMLSPATASISGKSSWVKHKLGSNVESAQLIGAYLDLAWLV